MLESIVLGTIQGVAEWLPVSSEGLIALAKIHLFGGVEVSDAIRLAVFLHLGTFLAALVYFRKEVWSVVQTVFRYQNAGEDSRWLLWFLVLATAVSGIVGAALLQGISELEGQLQLTGKAVTGIIGVLLLVTGFLQFQKKVTDKKEASKRLSIADGALVGLAQGLSILPGLSRSGVTVSTLLLRRYPEQVALRLSFLISLPAILGANILLNAERFTFDIASIFGLALAFLFGWITIYYLLKLARRINFGYFAVFFGLLMLVAVLV